MDTKISFHLENGWIIAEIDSEVYRIDPNKFLTMRSRLLRQFFKDFPSRNDLLKQIGNEFSVFYSNNRKVIDSWYDIAYEDWKKNKGAQI